MYSKYLTLFKIMISAIVLLDINGDLIAMRKYRDDFDLISIENYRVGVKERESPVVLVDGTSFLHYFEKDIYYVALTRQNANTCAIFEFLARLPKIFCQVLDIKEISVHEIKRYTPDIVELLDEMVDSGYLQNTDPEALRLLTGRQSSSGSDTQATLLATSAISWRLPNIVHKQNEIWTDITETVSVMMSATGEILESCINGTITMKSVLSGMPECRIEFNDPPGSESSADLDDMLFHQCVKLDDFAKDRAISFTPPDGEFELMRYRKTYVNGPFLITPLIRDSPGNRLEMKIQVKANYDPKLTASQVVLNIPLPQNTAEVDINSTVGRAKHVLESNSANWRCTSFAGTAQAEITISLRYLSANSRKTPVTKVSEPITVDFAISNFSASGLTLRSIKVTEKSNYTAEKMTRYLTKAGKYQIRMG